jgi:hypothetical protein
MTVNPRCIECGISNAALRLAALSVLLSACPSGGGKPESPGPVLPSDSTPVAYRTILPRAIVSGKAMNGFVGYVLTIPKVSANSECNLSAESLRRAALSITRFVPSEGILTLPIGDILYQSVVDRTMAGNVSYLAGTLSVTDSEVAEVIVEDTYGQEVNPDKIDVVGLSKLEQQRDSTHVCDYYFINKAFLTTVKSRTYSRIGGEAQFAFAVNFGGKRYGSTSKFQSQTELAIDARPLSSLLRPVVTNTSAGVDTVQRPVKLAVAKELLTATHVTTASSERLPAVVLLPSVWYEKQQARIISVPKR